MTTFQKVNKLLNERGYYLDKCDGPHFAPITHTIKALKTTAHGPKRQKLHSFYFTYNNYNGKETRHGYIYSQERGKGLNEILDYLEQLKNR